jgi:hypothetical protein
LNGPLDYILLAYVIFLPLFPLAYILLMHLFEVLEAVASPVERD